MDSSTSTMDSNANTSSALLLLFRLIETNDWEQLNAKFLVEPEGAKTFQRLAALVARSKSFNGMTILHACARFNPPPLIVSRVIELCPEAPSSRDCLRRTPLHVATGTGASTCVIKELTDAYPGACMVQDTDGRTPLHMACDSECELFDDDAADQSKDPPSYRTIGVLLSASLDSAILEDEEGMSAIEYALCSNANIKVVRLLQKATQKVMQKKHVEKSKQASTHSLPAAGTKLTPRSNMITARTA